ncbi:hypothetical protein [Paenibacillus pabuli]|uniref:hypothetical protein n=1 Tax=Paenibacillus pabuli TaxID=1472 RepID=UPI001FFEB2F1|nr:hypothetical protein [Paenibacillus pabuli]UPK41166.1 hypothetical protein KET34_17790 [Paenibacillus pabuli]
MEYIADRLAIASFTETPTLRNEDVRNLSQSIVKTMGETIDEYFMDGNSYKVFIKIQEESNLLLNITGNLLGQVHGLKLQKYLDQMQMEYFTLYLVRLSDELEYLYTRYPDWTGVRDLLTLAKIILDLWEALGVSFDADQEGVNIIISKPLV